MPSRARGAWTRIAGAGLGGFVALTTARLAHAETERDVTLPANGAEPTNDAGGKPIEPKPVPNYWLRLGLAIGGPINSDQERILSLEGYGGARFHFSVSAARKVTDYMGVGGLVMYGWRSADPDDEEQQDATETVVGDAPDYEEEFVVLAAQVPFSLALGNKRNALFFVTPFVGAGFGEASFNDHGDWQAGPAFGAGVGMFFPRAYLGFSFGAYSLPLPPPGEAGGHNDFGMMYLSLILGADVG